MTQTTDRPADRYMKREEAADALGISTRTLDRWIRAGKLPGLVRLPALRGPYCVRIPRASVEALLPEIPRLRHEVESLKLELAQLQRDVNILEETAKGAA